MSSCSLGVFAGSLSKDSFEEFCPVMTDLDGKIDERNMNPKSKMRGNPGSKGAPYNLLRPKSYGWPNQPGHPLQHHHLSRAANMLSMTVMR